MGKNTKKAFVLGIVFILLASGYKPLLLLTLGTKATGKIAKFYSVESTTRRGWTRYTLYAIIEFTTNKNESYRFSIRDYEGSIKVGRQPVLYLESYPELATVNTFYPMYLYFTVSSVVSLLIWIAFMTSFNTIFDR